jgi:hypothetical protein
MSQAQPTFNGRLIFNCKEIANNERYQCTTGTGWNGGSWFLTVYYF